MKVCEEVAGACFSRRTFNGLIKLNVILFLNDSFGFRVWKSVPRSPLCTPGRYTEFKSEDTNQRITAKHSSNKHSKDYHFFCCLLFRWNSLHKFSKNTSFFRQKFQSSKVQTGSSHSLNSLTKTLIDSHSIDHFLVRYYCNQIVRGELINHCAKI